LAVHCAFFYSQNESNADANATATQVGRLALQIAPPGFGSCPCCAGSYTGEHGQTLPPRWVWQLLKPHCLNRYFFAGRMLLRHYSSLLPPQKVMNYFNCYFICGLALLMPPVQWDFLLQLALS